jgi:hypothetical protein
MVRFMQQAGGRELLDVVGALGAPGGLSGGLDPRQQQPDQNADDGDHHQQFDQRKTTQGSHWHQLDT